MRLGYASIYWVALTSAVLSGCATTQEPMAIEQLLGCWYFEQGEGPEQLRLPWGVRLTEAPLQGWPAVQALEGVRAAATLTPAGDRDVPIAYWRPLGAGDSLHLGHPGGGGLAVDVAVPPAGDSPPVLRGIVRPVGDALAPGAQGSTAEPRPVRLGRARCPELG